jgi:hypothetical protein
MDMPAARKRADTAGGGRTPLHAIVRMSVFNHAQVSN